MTTVTTMTSSSPLGEACRKVFQDVNWGNGPSSYSSEECTKWSTCDCALEENGKITPEELHRAIDATLSIDDDVLFQSLREDHVAAARPLCEIFYKIHPNFLKEVLEKIVAKYVKNGDLTRFALVRALTHRTDIRFYPPAQIYYQPDKYFEYPDMEPYKNDKEEAYARVKFDYDHWTSIDLEARFEYFRLDPGLNIHHNHWHDIYDLNKAAPGNVHIDRGGEIFYFMHQQMLARYNFERVSLGFPVTEPLSNLREPLPEHHFNRLTTNNKAKIWDSRPPNNQLMVRTEDDFLLGYMNKLYVDIYYTCTHKAEDKFLSQHCEDVNINGRVIRISDLELWRDRIYNAIDSGYYYTVDQAEDKHREKLDSPYPWKENSGLLDYGIDKLGDMIQANFQRSVNPTYYGNLHNSGHLLIAYSHDPKGVYNRQSVGGVMSASETSPRDPAFYRWHSFIDDIYIRYKNTLKEYPIDTLEFKDVEIKNVQLCDELGQYTSTLITKWFVDRVDVSGGIDTDKKNSWKVKKVFYEYVHLGHEKFSYQIRVENKSKTKKIKGTVRIFMAPVYKSPYSREPNLTYNEYRRMFIELDKFVVTLDPGKEHTFCRSSSESNVTIPIDQLFTTYDQCENISNRTTSDQPGKTMDAWCGCGWPDYLLIGRGNASKDGLECKLFVMISDYDLDKVDEESEGEFGEVSDGECRCIIKSAEKTNDDLKAAMSYCGRFSKLYPDKKPMGYPFDRPVQDPGLTFEEFVTESRAHGMLNAKPLPNMKHIKFFVRHVGKNEAENGPTMPKNAENGPTMSKNAENGPTMS